jgi:cell division protein ZapD
VSAVSQALQFYEQPLNERMRAFLRLEHLFRGIEAQIGSADKWASRGALEGIIELTALLTRAEIKSELIKELERNAQTLEALAKDPRVDGTALTDTLDDIRTILTALRMQDGAFGHELRNNDLVNTVRQRTSIPAGTCDFDVPMLHYWLSKGDSERESDLRRWFASFTLIREAVELSLSLVRRSASATLEQAQTGFFQKTLDPNVPCQLVRVAVPADSGCFTEISAGKHRFTVRFIAHERADDRPRQIDSDIQFELHCCML